MCAVERINNTVEDTSTVARVIPIAGDFTASHGRALDPKWQRLKNGASNSDSDREGLIVEFNGGKYPEKQGTLQKAIVQFECDKDRTGNEEYDVEGEKAVEERSADGDDEKKPKEGDDKSEEDEEKNKSLRFISYKAEGDVDVLRLTWRTKYACEEVLDEGGDSKNGWGFFGWVFIM